MSRGVFENHNTKTLLVRLCLELAKGDMPSDFWPGICRQPDAHLGFRSLQIEKV